MSSEDRRKYVQDYYAAIVNQSASSCCSGGCDCGSGPEPSASETKDGITILSLGCGFPVEHAAIQPGETVVDLGSGAGLDCFRAAQQVGAEGRVIGVDMTPEMLAKARGNAETLQMENVEFRQGFLEDLPIVDQSVDVVISNCVINLSPDKPRVFAEIYRILRPGGRLVVSDIVTDGPLPEAVLNDPQAWGACVAGALDQGEYQAGLEAAGFDTVSVSPDQQFEDATPGSPPVFSALIAARKPAAK